MSKWTLFAGVAALFALGGCDVQVHDETPTSQVAKKLGRTAAAVQQKAMRAGISFRAAKRSGARKKK